jgi:hypothetical protein
MKPLTYDVESRVVGSDVEFRLVLVEPERVDFRSRLADGLRRTWVQLTKKRSGDEHDDMSGSIGSSGEASVAGKS